MVDSSSFDLKPTFPIASIAELYANRPVKEAAMRAQQQQQLVEGLKGFGSGVESLVAQRMRIAQALAAAQMFGQSPEGQQMMGTNPVTSTPASPMPVTPNQTAAFDPTSGTVTPNQSPVNTGTLQTALLGLNPKDLLENLVQQRAAKTAQSELALKQQIEPQQVAIEGKKAAAEEESNRIQRLIQGMLATNTISNQAAERKQAEENAARQANEEIAKHPFLHPFAAHRAVKALEATGQGGSGVELPAVGQTITHSSGVKITRRK